MSSSLAFKWLPLEHSLQCESAICERTGREDPDYVQNVANPEWVTLCNSFLFRLDLCFGCFYFTIYARFGWIFRNKKIYQKRERAKPHKLLQICRWELSCSNADTRLAIVSMLLHLPTSSQAPLVTGGISGAVTAYSSLARPCNTILCIFICLWQFLLSYFPFYNH